MAEVDLISELAVSGSGGRYEREVSDRRDIDVNGDGVVANGSLSWGDDRPYAVAATQALSRR